jgi:hypothetical protein
MNKRLLLGISILLLSSVLSAFSPMTTAQTPTIGVVQSGDIPKPGEPGQADITLIDADSSLKAKEKRVLTGDTFTKNLYERPFTSKDMIYQPDVNILKVFNASDENYFYFTLELDGLDPATKTLSATYGIEFDRTKTGRGDLLVWVQDLNKEWSMNNLKVFSDPKKTIGGPSPMLADEGYQGNGYENEVKLEGDKVAYARLAPDSPTQVQIAVSRMLLDNPKEFLWGAWADKGLRDPMRFDYNDHFGLSAAGSPIKNDKDYPIKDVFSLDNTCRLPFGFTATSDIRGMCDIKVCKSVTTFDPRTKIYTTKKVCK